MRVRIKVCGLLTLEDTLMCVDMGVDAVGFVFHKVSKRFIHPKDAVEIVKRLPPFVSKVAVLTQLDMELINYLIGGRFDVLQLYFDIDEELINELEGVSIIRAGMLKELMNIQNIERYDAVLVDNDKIGGEKLPVDWDMVKEWRRDIRLPLIAAGGLTAQTVGLVIDKVRPYAVDVASGVEDESTGRKDYTKLRDFVSAVFNR